MTCMNPRPIATLFALLLALTTALGGLRAQEDATKYLDLEASFSPAKPQPGREVVLDLAILMKDEWHLYGAATESNEPPSLSSLTGLKLEKLGGFDVPDGERHEPAPGIVDYWLMGSFHLKQKYRIPAGTEPGTYKLKGSLAIAACTPEYCDPPADYEFEVVLVVAAPEAKSGVQGKTPGAAQGGGEAPELPAGVGFGQDLFGGGVGGKKVTVLDVRVEPSPIRPGETGRLIVEARIQQGWHVYGAKDEHPAKMDIEGGELIQTKGKTLLPAGEKHGEPPIVNYWVLDNFTIERSFTLLSGAEAGKMDFKAYLRYLPCTPEICDPDEEVEVQASLQIEMGPARAEYLSSAAAEIGTDIDDVKGAGLLQFLLLCMGAGLVALIMPCTYPMIPITISFFTKQATEREGKVLGLSLVYGAGIILMFILIGVVVGDPIVRFATHWITNLFIGVVFVVFGLSLLGYITITPPRALMNLAGTASTKGGYGGVFLMGLTLVITSFTCTAPFIGTVLALGGSGGDQGRVALGMGVFGLTMAAPFVVLSLVPGKMAALPRSGQWMNTIKIFLGFVEIAAAVKFLSNADVVLHEPLWLEAGPFFWIWTVIFALAGLYLLGLIDPKGKPVGFDYTNGARRMFGVLTLLLAVFFAFQAMPNLWPKDYSRDYVMAAFAPPGNKAKHTLYKDDFEKALAAAKNKDKLLLLNFTGFS